MLKRKFWRRAYGECARTEWVKVDANGSKHSAAVETFLCGGDRTHANCTGVFIRRCRKRCIVARESRWNDLVEIERRNNGCGDFARQYTAHATDHRRWRNFFLR